MDKAAKSSSNDHWALHVSKSAESASEATISNDPVFASLGSPKGRSRTDSLPVDSRL